MAEEINDPRAPDQPAKEAPEAQRPGQASDRGGHNHGGGGRGGPRGGGRGGYRRRSGWRRKVCRFCADKSIKLDYKDYRLLQSFVSESGKIVPARTSGNCARHQRRLAVAIKRARALALLPYSTLGF